MTVQPIQNECNAWLVCIFNCWMGETLSPCIVYITMYCIDAMGFFGQFKIKIWQINILFSHVKLSKCNGTFLYVSLNSVHICQGVVNLVVGRGVKWEILSKLLEGLHTSYGVPTQNFWWICVLWSQWPLHANLLTDSYFTPPSDICCF